jgi:hypothetical protein
MTCTDGSFIDRWVNHMEGATKLIEIRGSEQLARQEGLKLFTQLRAQVVSCYKAIGIWDDMLINVNIGHQPNIPGTIQLISFYKTSRRRPPRSESR